MRVDSEPGSSRADVKLLDRARSRARRELLRYAVDLQARREVGATLTALGAAGLLAVGVTAGSPEVIIVEEQSLATGVEYGTDQSSPGYCGLRC